MPQRNGPRTYLVECYWAGVTECEVAAAAWQAEAASARLRRRGLDFKFLSSRLIPAKETVFCLSEGIESDIRAISVQAGIPVERILEPLRLSVTEQARAEQ